ncbi:glycine--tRNA ligase subunit beta [Rickettsiales bacterium]|nr:glycine--tRNA ligase subunit beta [Rickettsiales bacterium]
MSEFLLEIFCEEIPARMQKKAIDDFEDIFCNFFTENNITFNKKQISSFISPNRMIFVAQDIPNFKITPEKERFGPKINANQNAIDGFLKSVNLNNISDLEIRIKNSSEYYYTKIKEEKINIIDILENQLPILLKKMSLKWPKTMRWHGSNSNEDFWVRPIRNILAIFDKKIINCNFANLSSQNYTLINDKDCKIIDFKSYKDQLSENKIIFDQNQRKEIIYNSIEKICHDNQIDIIEDPYNSSLIDEIIGLASSPNVLLGKIDDEFMDLPPEILILTIKNHQKYLCTKDQYGNLAPYFIFISDIDCKNNPKIIADNEKVLRARLNDAKFFIDEDNKIEFFKRTNLLKNIIFHEKLDSLYDKIHRVNILNKFMSIWIPHCDITILEEMSLLCKNDLTTKAVAEFPELQGMVGSYYCKKSKINSKISEAIAEQYMPVGANGGLPMTNHGQLLAISDKLDTICGLFLVNQRPTSSKDPLAIRRMAIGIINIILKSDLHIPLKIIIDKSLTLFPNSVILKNYPDLKPKEIPSLKKKISYEIIHFFLERLKFILKDDSSLNLKIINEVSRSYEDQLKHNRQRKYNLIDFVARIRFINDFSSNSENQPIINSYKRVANIVNIEQEKDNDIFNPQLKRKILLRTKYERILDNQTRRIYKKVEKLTTAHKYQECFDLLKILEQPLEDFFENVTINIGSKNVRNQRLTLLARIKHLFENIFDFSKI